MTKKIDKQKAMENMGKEAHRLLIKSELMRFPLEEECFDRLLKYAYNNKKLAGPMVRTWVLEKLDQLENKKKKLPEIEAINIITGSLAERGLLEWTQFRRINKSPAPKAISIITNRFAKLRILDLTSVNQIGRVPVAKAISIIANRFAERGIIEEAHLKQIKKLLAEQNSYSLSKESSKSKRLSKAS